MKEIERRLSALEQKHQATLEPLQIVRTIIEAKEGRALAWDPTWAHDRGASVVIARRKCETSAAFEHRAAEFFDGRDYVIGGGSLPERAKR